MKGQYEERFTKEGGGDHATRLFFFGALLDLERGELSFGVRRNSSGGTGLLGVLGTGARISI